MAAQNSEAANRSGWGATSVSAGVLSLGSIGDALIYVVLPVSAAAFGVSMAWVGVLLAANRIVRIVFYGTIASFGNIIGPRRLAIAGAVAAAASTLMYWMLSGGPALLAARILWGLAFAGLSLAALGIAVADKDRAGSRVGVSRAIHQIGPALALSVGAWLVGIVGPRDIFLILGLISALAIPLAFALPRHEEPVPGPRTSLIPRPVAHDFYFFMVGLAVDGVFIMTVGLMLAAHVSPETAIFFAGLILTARRVGEVVLAPLGGMVGDRIGVGRTLFAATVLLAFGFLCLSLAWLAAGIFLVIVARATIAALGPAFVALRADDSKVLYRLAVMQTWRDVGAGIGPLATGFVLEIWGLQAINGALVVLVLLGILALRPPRSTSKPQQPPQV